MKRVASWLMGRGPSAEQPADGAPDGSAEQPADDDSKRRKWEEKGPLQTSVGYLAFPAKNYDLPAERQHVIEAVQSWKDSHVSVINIAFIRADDLESMWSDLKKEIRRKSSAAQPASEISCA